MEVKKAIFGNADKTNVVEIDAVRDEKVFYRYAMQSNVSRQSRRKRRSKTVCTEEYSLQ